MKKIMMAVISTCIIFQSCTLEKKLTGMWRITDAALVNVYLKNDIQRLEKIANKIKNDNGFAEFNKDKSGTMKIAGVSGTIFWHISNDKKYIYTVNERKDTTQNEIIELKNKLLKIKSAGPLGDVIIIFEKNNF